VKGVAMLKNLFGSKHNNRDNKYKFITQEPTTKTCPNCGEKLEKIPNWKNGKMDCPNCGGVIAVRSGKLFTEDEVNVRDSLDKCNRSIYDYEITRDKFNQTREKLSQEFGCVASVNDTLWRILNSINTPDKSYQDRKFIYFVMAEILEKEAKSTKEIMTQARKMELLDIKSMGFKKVKIQVYGGVIDDYVCDECKKLNNKVLTIDEALKTMPIPNRCKNEQCRCSYGAYFD
jgi:hypothetical protein